MKLLALRSILFTALVACTANVADKYSVTVPTSLSELPILYSMIGEQSTYREASYKAQEAFFMQPGTTQRIDSLKAFATKKVERTTAHFIDHSTLFRSEHVFLCGAVGYSVLIKKQISSGSSSSISSNSLRNPIFKTVTHTISVDKRTQTLSTQISF